MNPATLVLTLLETVGLWAGVIACGFGAGYSFGWTIPDWTIDSTLEGDPGIAPYYGGRSAYGSGGGGCLLPYLLLRYASAAGWMSNLVAIAFAVVAGICVLQLWHPTDPGEIEYADFEIWFQKPLWAALAAAAGGYIVARVNDKGPVGPLE